MMNFYLKSSPGRARRNNSVVSNEIQQRSKRMSVSQHILSPLNWRKSFQSSEKFARISKQKIADYMQIADEDLIFEDCTSVDT